MTTEPAAPSDTPTAVRVCVYCRTPIAGGAPGTQCDACDASYHVECWEENDGCAVYGCDRAASVEPRSALEIPVSYWGKEEKPCPSCHNSIQAAARRCRHCGATFDSVRPESTGEFRRRQQAREIAPGLKKVPGWLFVLCLLPPTAPIAALVGVAWYRVRRDALASLPPVYSGVTKLAIAVGLGQTAIITILTIVYALGGGM